MVRAWYVHRAIKIGNKSLEWLHFSPHSAGKVQSRVSGSIESLFWTSWKSRLFWDYSSAHAVYIKYERRRRPLHCCLERPNETISDSGPADYTQSRGQGGTRTVGATGSRASHTRSIHQGYRAANRVDSVPAIDDRTGVYLKLAWQECQVLHISRGNMDFLLQDCRCFEQCDGRLNARPLMHQVYLQ